MRQIAKKHYRNILFGIYEKMWKITKKSNRFDIHGLKSLFRNNSVYIEYIKISENPIKVSAVFHYKIMPYHDIVT